MSGPADNNSFENSILQQLLGYDPNWTLSWNQVSRGEDTWNEAVFSNSSNKDYLTKLQTQGDAANDYYVLNTYSKRPYQYSDNLNSIYDARQLGYTLEDQQRLEAAGIKGLPAYMLKKNLYSNAYRLGNDDPIQTFINAYNMVQTKNFGDSKGKKALMNLGWGVDSSGRMVYVGKDDSNMTTSSLRVNYLGDPNAQWTEDDTEVFIQRYLSNKWEPNDSGYLGTEKLTGLIAGLASIAAPIAGLAAAGAFTAPVVAAEAGAVGGAGAAIGAGAVEAGAIGTVEAGAIGLGEAGAIGLGELGAVSTEGILSGYSLLGPTAVGEFLPTVGVFGPTAALESYGMLGAVAAGEILPSVGVVGPGGLFGTGIGIEGATSLTPLVESTLLEQAVGAGQQLVEKVSNIGLGDVLKGALLIGSLSNMLGGSTGGGSNGDNSTTGNTNIVTPDLPNEGDKPKPPEDRPPGEGVKDWMQDFWRRRRGKQYGTKALKRANLTDKDIYVPILF